MVVGPDPLHAVAAIGSHAVVGVDLAGDDPDIEVMFRTLPTMRTLTKRARADLVG